ncbi:hypothetical protein LR48_Vigan07g127600 [Vigna angularis]|uniref:Uncharacterized protein n=1 Tax=Phaseolus angularis TaxID=3914 RepID=A0A0L9UYB6_PHAAN|nr:hypothetical protein LR48_Vigan07g127600 [Vigna angularis]
MNMDSEIHGVHPDILMITESQVEMGVSRGRHAGGSTKREDPVVMEAAPPITAKLSSMQKDTADWEKLMDVLVH